MRTPAPANLAIRGALSRRRHRAPTALAITALRAQVRAQSTQEDRCGLDGH